MIVIPVRGSLQGWGMSGLEIRLGITLWLGLGLQLQTGLARDILALVYSAVTLAAVAFPATSACVMTPAVAAFSPIAASNCCRCRRRRALCIASTVIRLRVRTGTRVLGRVRVGVWGYAYPGIKFPVGLGSGSKSGLTLG